MHWEQRNTGVFGLRMGTIPLMAYDYQFCPDDEICTGFPVDSNLSFSKKDVAIYTILWRYNLI